MIVEPTITRAGQPVHRVRDIGTGHEYTVAASAAVSNPHLYVVLDKPAVDSNGVPLEPKFRILQPAHHNLTIEPIVEEGNQA